MCNPGEAARDDGAEKEGYPEEGREHTIRYVTDRMRGRVPPFMPVSQSRRGWYHRSPGPWPGVEIRKRVQPREGRRKTSPAVMVFLL